MESISRLERGLPPIVRGGSEVTIKGVDFLVTWHHYQNPAGWVEDDITIDNRLTLDADLCQELLDSKIYEDLMEAVERQINKGPLD
jgi:hypothetical protein